MTSQSLTEVARIVLVYGLTRVMAAPFRQLVSALSQAASSTEDEHTIDELTRQRVQVLADAIDQYGGGTPFKDGPQPRANGQDTIRTLMGPWQAASRHLGAAATPFEAFATAAIQRVLASRLPAKDMAILNDVALMLALGTLSYGASGTPLNDLQTWATQAADRSGIMDVLTSGAHIVAGWTGDRRSVAAPAAKSTPHVGGLFDLGDMSRTIAAGRISGASVSRFKRMLPLQNLYYLRRGLDAMQTGMSSTFAAPGASSVH